MVPAPPHVLRKMVTPRRYRDPEYAVTVAAELYGGRMREQPDEVRRLIHQHSRLGSRRGYLLQLLAGAGWTSLPVLPFIRQPTLILAGSDDPIIPLVNARVMHRLLPHADLHVFDDGHLGLVTSAGELAPRIAEFLRT
jgi:pimeloyl-ACP methyl ester carboxylesterase